MSHYYDLGFEKGKSNYEQNIWEEFASVRFEGSISADEQKDWRKGYYDGWCAADVAFEESVGEKAEEAYQEGYEQGESDFPHWNFEKWESTKFDDAWFEGYRDGFEMAEEESEDY